MEVKLTEIERITKINILNDMINGFSDSELLELYQFADDIVSGKMEF